MVDLQWLEQPLEPLNEAHHQLHRLGTNFRPHQSIHPLLAL